MGSEQRNRAERLSHILFLRARPPRQRFNPHLRLIFQRLSSQRNRAKLFDERSYLFPRGIAINRRSKTRFSKPLNIASTLRRGA
jgi:hypothetical protein